MIIETDVLYAYVKKGDWLKETARKIVSKITGGEFDRVYVSRECLHEICYVSREEGVSTDELINRAAALTAIQNVTFLEHMYYCMVTDADGTIANTNTVTLTVI